MFPGLSVIVRRESGELMEGAFGWHSFGIYTIGVGKKSWRSLARINREGCILQIWDWNGHMDEKGMLEHVRDVVEESSLVTSIDISR
jgi:hypothetical protein